MKQVDEQTLFDKGKLNGHFFLHSLPPPRDFCLHEKGLGDTKCVRDLISLLNFFLPLLSLVAHFI